MLRIHRTRLRVKRSNVARTGCQTDLRQTEVQNLSVSAFGDENVRRLDVTMHDPLGMRRVQRIRDLYGQR